MCIKKVLCVVLSCILIVCLFPMNGLIFTIQAAQEETATISSGKLPFYASAADSRSVLDYTGTIDVEKMKKTLKDALTIYAGDVILGSSYKWPATRETMELIANLIVCEIPEGFHFESVEATYNTSTNYITKLNFDYNMSKEEYTDKLNECKLQADVLLDGIIGNNKLTDAEKALLVHDRLALHCEYGDVNGSYLDTATLYGALVGRMPVCQGYAIAYTYLLEKLGMQSDMCVSDAMDHAWNIVYIDNEAYHVDVTWDDPTPDIPGQVYHYNFLLSTQQLKKGFGDIYDNAHNANDFPATPTSTKYDSYYWQNSYAPFRLFNDRLYYIDNINATLCDAANQQVLKTIDGLWYINTREYLPECYANLSSDSKFLYYSTPTAIYSFNPTDNTSSCIYEPQMTINGKTYYSLLGFKYEAGTFEYVLCNENGLHFDTHQYCTDHTWNDGTVYKTAYCDIEGFVGYRCTNCAASRIVREKDSEKHAYTYSDNNVLPTCGAPGKQYDSICRACNTIVTVGKEIPATGRHTWEETSVREHESCSGVQHVLSTCTVCSATKEDIRTTENAVHSGNTELRNVSEPTCGIYGYTGDVYCLACEQIVTKGKDIPKKTEHSWDEGRILNPPSEYYEGTMRYQCTVCRRTKDEPIPPTGEPVKAPGDVFYDGTITAQDARICLRASVGLETLTNEQQLNADVDNDNTVTAADARLILRYSVGLETAWPS